ncbi:50S ribosomal protein L13 [Mycoplasmoides gallisepticum]|uniref:Large ribosomal subunit protein uL13 n=1 Tax=Mycoplasmoides gallisepticum TaxID=2096 RepID=A0AB36DS88_MYCGL|nr:50S ribosomal protein L13 [Mycoplasmoides gallisepticum]OBU78688.1 50S ribosomal protein L13 [Mycoplasmoides gallisepticum]OBU79085.1 50S ribosomal protein L13 [Mycoplasmoides gallisepticum]OBU80432.1 50S ribosomal protein L13 [Mycoplasmoides gallisepticum]OBU80655.1 50S ribosomal protein L13 [Mycoplasmoides gallisepticum]OBU81399.1 50S ribosomal protein L13 [Mycoplasmoides gallisepticum]
MQKTTMQKPVVATKNRKWYLVDASGLVLGRLAVKAANLLRGKNKPDFTPNVDCGDYLIILNSDKVVLTGNKLDNEKWYRHSNYMGGIKSRTGREMVDHYSDQLVYDAIRRMLPKNRLAKDMMRKLKVYKNDHHEHDAQQSTKLDWSK